ncbi:hypothetical protein [Methylobacterium sp. B4]|uniref:hypothetical protein n=1 Tax=Methylobacterium sp. B4 TaxID=1938755 RepID=UPI0011B6CB58|nr:hypothetical protein [Methylobacterium sp. B4]
MGETIEFGRRGLSAERRLTMAERGVELRGLYNQDVSGLEGAPISIQINVGRSEGPANDKKPFSLLSSKLFWLVVSLALAAGVAYGRTRMVCQSFKDAGQFYYGMDVDRCIGVVRHNPLAPAASMLEQVNRSY